MYEGETLRQKRRKLFLTVKEIICLDSESWQGHQAAAQAAGYT